jgi:hypothetical protein
MCLPSPACPTQMLEYTETETETVTETETETEIETPTVTQTTDATQILPALAAINIEIIIEIESA